jgi:hypothetical protein
MCGDSIGTCGFAERRSRHRIRLVTATCLPKSRDVIYVDVQALMSCWHLSRPLGSQQFSWRNV